MLHSLVAHLEAGGGSLPSLRSIAYGSAAVTPDLVRRLAAVVDVELHHGYGMTETAGNVTFLGPGQHRDGLAGDETILRSVGRPHAGVEVRLVDGAGGDVGPGEAGEIAVRGAQVMLGYWRDGQPVDDDLADGWFRTGDAGRLDERGHLVIVDRLKDVIVTGGENVSSREVEEVLATHPAVAAVAVVGVPDDYWGEAICAVVVPVADPPTPHELADHVRARIAAFKRPRHVVCVEELPRTSNGKVAKAELRRLAAAFIACG
jgi:acyl-CoA synthetase (AMP-forming)/AMP-acid ligase II